jgi:hypothetical protein
VAVVPIVFLLGLIAVETGTQVLLLPSVERRIGARIMGPTVLVDGKIQEVMAFENVGPGAVANAGLVSGDIIVSHRLIGQLSRELRGPKGKQVVVEVVPGGNGPPIDKRPSRRVVITLP